MRWKSLEFSFFASFVSFYRFPCTVQLSFAYFAGSLFLMILRGKICVRPTRIDPLPRACPAFNRCVYIVFHINDLRSLKWGVIFHKVLSWSHATLLIQRKVASFQYFFFISFFKIFDDILLSLFFFRVWRLRNPSIFHHFFDQSVTSNEIKQCWQYSLKYFCSKGWSISFARCFLHSMKNSLPIDDRRSILFIDNYPTMRQRCLISV